MLELGRTTRSVTFDRRRGCTLVVPRARHVTPLEPLGLNINCWRALRALPLDPIACSDGSRNCRWRIVIWEQTPCGVQRRALLEYRFRGRRETKYIPDSRLQFHTKSFLICENFPLHLQVPVGMHSYSSESVHDCMVSSPNTDDPF